MFFILSKLYYVIDVHGEIKVLLFLLFILLFWVNIVFSFDTSFMAGLKLVLGLESAKLRVRVTFQKVKQ